MALFRIFGAGEWGLAIASHLALLDNTVEVYLRDQTKIDLYQTNNHHDSLDIKFDNIYFHNINSINNIKKTDKAIDIIATSSSGFLPIIKDNIDYFQSCDSLSWITKGLDHDSGLLFHEVLDQVLSRKVKKCIISGPSFAKDLVAKKPLEVSIASSDNLLMDKFITSMHTDLFKLIPTNDITGIEVSGVLKNISGILAGALTANQFSDEYIDELIAISQKEVKRITRSIIELDSIQVSDIELERTLESPGCLGDLRLTCFYNTSRNRQLGLKLTENCDVDKLISRIGTVEGYLSTATLFNNQSRYGNGSIVRAANDILYNHLKPRNVLDALFN